MAFFDIFTNDAQNAAQQAQTNQLNQAYQQYSAILPQATGALSSNFDTGLGSLNQNYNIGTGALGQNYGSAIKSLYGGAGMGANAFGTGVDRVTGAYGMGAYPSWNNYGVAQQGMGALGDALGLGGDAGNARATAAFWNNPAIQSQLDIGDQNILRNQAATGQLASGATNVDLQQFGQQTAAQGWKDYVSSLQPYLSFGQGAAGTLANTYGNEGNTLGGLYTGLAGLYGSTGQAGANVWQGLGNQTNQNYTNLANTTFQGYNNLGTGLSKLYDEQGQAAYGTQAGIGNAQASADLAGLTASGNIWGAIAGAAGAAAGGGGAGAFSGIKNMFGGGTAPYPSGGTAPIPYLPGKADGGPAHVGEPIIVGERGPEIFMPDRSGTIIPNHQVHNYAGGLKAYADGGRIAPPPGDVGYGGGPMAGVPLIAPPPVDGGYDGEGYGGGPAPYDSIIQPPPLDAFLLRPPPHHRPHIGGLKAYAGGGPILPPNMGSGGPPGWPPGRPPGMPLLGGPMGAGASGMQPGMGMPQGGNPAPGPAGGQGAQGNPGNSLAAFSRGFAPPPNAGPAVGWPSGLRTSGSPTAAGPGGAFPGGLAQTPQGNWAQGLRGFAEGGRVEDRGLTDFSRPFVAQPEDPYDPLAASAGIAPPGPTPVGSSMLQHTIDLAAAPGRFLQRRPQTPGMLTDEEQAITNLNEEAAPTWGREVAMNMAASRIPFAKAGELGSFGGRLAKTANIEKLAEAERMAAAGVDRREIWDKTGWFQGAGDHWQFEIPDKASKFSPEWKAGQPRAADLKRIPEGSMTAPRDISDQFLHEPLYEAYPELRNTQISSMVPKPIPGGIVKGMHKEASGAGTPAWLGINARMPMKEQRSTVLHELGGHGIQDIEGFPRGASLNSPEVLEAADARLVADQAKAQSRIDAILAQRDAWLREQGLDPKSVNSVAASKVFMAKNPTLRWDMDLAYATLEGNPAVRGMYKQGAYSDVAGEVQARNVQMRRDFTPKQRRDNPPWETEDTPREQQILRYDRPGLLNAEPKLELRDTEGPAAGLARVARGEEVEAPAVQRPALRAPQRGIIDPQQMLYPGIYKDPRVIAQEAAAATAPEDIALKKLFGVTRDDLFQIAQEGRREGNRPPIIEKPAGARGIGYAAQNIMTPENARRIVDTLGETKKASPELYKGMVAWYVHDPLFLKMKNEVGEEAAIKFFNRLNTGMGTHSPASDVLTEINRGTGANMMAERGQFDKYLKYGGAAEGDRGRNFPKELRDVLGHPYHSTAQAPAFGRYLETGDLSGMQSAKVPNYITASGVPETGFQTKGYVPDAHISRSLGMADTRRDANPGRAMNMREWRDTVPWYEENIARPMGIEPVPAQAFQWGAYAPQTGVDTAIGAPKLELLARRVMDRAQKLGVDPERLLMDVAKGKNHAVNAGLLAAPAAAGALARQRGEE